MRRHAPRRRLALVAGLIGAALVTTIPAGAPAVAAGREETLHGLAPARLLDTRPGYPTIDGQFAGAGQIGPNATTQLTVIGRGGVPATGAGAVAINISATGATAGSFLTVWPTGAPRPTAANLNFEPGDTVSNMTIVPVGDGGQISLFNYAGSAHLIVDVLGWFPTGDAFHGLTPARLLDTRPGYPTIDGQFAGAGQIGPSATAQLTVIGRGGVPATGAGAVAINISATGATAGSFLTVWPTGAPRPTAANLNFEPGDTVSNMTIVPVGDGGQISLFNYAGSAHLIVDVLGWFPTGDAFHGLTPARLLDTRPGYPTIDGHFAAMGALGQDWDVPASGGSDDLDPSPRTMTLTVLGRGGVPSSGVGAVAINIVATGSNRDSYVTSWPTGVAVPTAATLTAAPGATVPNMAIVPVGTDGRISLFNYSGKLDLVVDVLGWFPESTTPLSFDRRPVTVGGIELISHRPPGAGYAESFLPTISKHFFVAFSSYGALIANDHNQMQDVFAQTARGLVQVSTAFDGTNADGPSFNPSISSDGNIVAFVSSADNLVPGDTNNLADVFVRDLRTNVTTLASRGIGGVPANGEVPILVPLSLSADGRFVAFVSSASNLVPGDTNDTFDVFVFDRLTGATSRESVRSDGTQNVAGVVSTDPSVSSDGRYVAFSTFQPTDIPGVIGGNSSVFVRDRWTGALELISEPVPAGTRDHYSSKPTISLDGRYVSYVTTLTDTHGVTRVDVYLRDRQAGTTEQVNVIGEPGNTTPIAAVEARSPVSADGHLVAFVVDDGAGGGLFVRDTERKVTTMLSDSGSSPALASDGHRIAFASGETLAGDGDGIDIFAMLIG